MEKRRQKEIRQTRTPYQYSVQLLRQFRQLKQKCAARVEEYDLDLPELESFKEIDKCFAIDLSLLTQQMLHSRRNKLNEGNPSPYSAIDRIMTLESTLDLKILKKNSQRIPAQPPAQPPSRIPKLFAQTRQVENQTKLNEKPKGDLTDRVNKPPRQRVQDMLVVNSNCSLSKNQLQSIRAQYAFDQQQLKAVWKKYQPTVDETPDDKLDRISKIVGFLKGAVSGLAQKQNKSLRKGNSAQQTEYSKLIEKIQQQKAIISELQEKNQQLERENQRLKAQKGESARYKLPAGFMNEATEVLYANQDFKIVKVVPKANSTRHSSLEKQKSCPQTNLPNILKYVFLLQQKIVDSLPLLSDSSNPQSKSTQLTKPKSLSHLKFPQVRTRTSLDHNLDQSKMRAEASTSASISGNSDAKEIKDVGTKLNQIRQQRKRIFQDDDIWNQIQNLKL